APPVHGHEQAGIGVDQHRAVDGHPATVRPGQTGDQIDERSLARTGTAEQGGEPALARPANVEGEGSEPLPEIDLDRHADSAPRRGRRTTSSEARIAPSERRMETKVRRSAPTSPPGTCSRV